MKRLTDEDKTTIIDGLRTAADVYSADAQGIDNERLRKLAADHVARVRALADRIETERGE
jgi:nitrogen-specific signal transduction histidine kinase